MKGPILFMVLVIAVTAGVFMYTSENVKDPRASIREIPQDAPYQIEAYKNKRLSLQAYLNLHISDLSPVQETLGGHFYVTEVRADNGEGTVKYEDGHMQYIADFSYRESPEGYVISNFRVRE